MKEVTNADSLQEIKYYKLQVLMFTSVNVKKSNYITTSGFDCVTVQKDDCIY